MLYILTSIGFFLWSIRMILFWVMLWQVKEYRLDRLSVHLRETAQGRALVFSPFIFSSLALILLYSIVVLNDFFPFWYHAFVFLYFAILGFIFIKELSTAKFKRPAVTLKSTTIFILSTGFMCLAYIVNLLDMYVWLLIIGLIIPFIVAIFVFTFSFPTEIYKDYIVQKARAKILSLPNLLVIGVSGSYGKTSTKEYIAHILSRKFSVVKTPLSNNTPIAIAKTILHHVTHDTQILIVEIGSYKKGEVAEICDIIRPKMSITTGLGEQHVSLYGSMKNIIESEKELIHALPKDGIAFFNANSPFMEKLYMATRKPTILYGSNGTRHKKPLTIASSNIMSGKNGIAFTARMGKSSLVVRSPLLGAHNVENILPGIYLGRHLGMSNTEIARAVAHITPLPKTMKKFTTQEGVILIDDTFNASPESVISAANYMRVYNKKKIFVLMPLIELGAKASEYHYNIGRTLATCNYLFLTNKNFLKDIKKGIRDSKGKCKILIEKPEILAEKINQITKRGDVVIFEGKEAGNVLNKLL